MGVLERTWRFLTLQNVVSQFQFGTESRKTFTSGPIDRVIYEMTRTSGRVSRAEALTVPAVLKARNIICSFARLPLEQMSPTNEVTRLSLLEQIDPDVPNSVTLAQTIEDLLFEGVSYWRITGFGWDGYPVSARHIDTKSVTLQPPSGNGNLAPLPGGQDPRGAKVYIDGVGVSWEEIIRFDSPNPALMVVAGDTIRQAVALHRAATLYTNNPRPMDFFTPSDGADPVDDEEVQDIIDKWSYDRTRQTTAYVPSSLKYNTVDVPTPVELQLVERQRQNNLDLANATGLDPEDLGVSTTSRTYQNATDRRQDRINDTLSPFMAAIEQRLSMSDVTKRGYFIRFNLDDYLRADPLTRVQVYAQYLAMGATTVDEIRAEEKLPPLPESVKSEPAAVEGAPSVNGVAQNEPSNVVAIRPVSLTFDDGSAQHTFLNVPVTQFKVDLEKRTIEGLALPYGSVASKYGFKYRFNAGALQFNEPSRVKLLRDHDSSQAIGVLIHHEDRSDGMFVRFKVGRGPQGDEALLLAEDKILDGFSVGVDFDMATDTIPDPDNKGVTLVHRADWRETSLTAMPAFDDARVTKVAASRDKGVHMDPCTTCGQQHAPSVACTAPTQANGSENAAVVRYSLNDINNIRSLFGAPQREVADVILAAEPMPEPRAIVNPTRSLTASVNEAAPYRFDNRGNLMRGSHDFCTDLVLAGRDRDQAAYDRALAFAASQFAIDTTAAGPLTPTVHYPSLYVDQREYKYPLWSMVSKGVGPLSDGMRSFDFPKYNTAGVLVTGHVQGVEPTVGDVGWTTQTVTPTALSGKAKMTREVWDMGGDPNISNLIWKQMERQYYELLEASVATFLNTLTAATDIALTTGGGTTGQTLSAELEAAIADLQFVRGGNTFEAFAAHIDLYKALAAAKDNDKRPLYPQISPMNANGTAATYFRTMNVAGTTVVPAWALGATSSGSSNSWLFDPLTVHGWATPPKRLDFDIEVANIYIGIWGYKAFANIDINGVRQVTYDPV